MKGPVFFDGQDVRLDDLSEMIDSLVSETKLRFGQMALGGIVSDMTLTPNGTNNVTVSAGTVLNSDGELVSTDSTDLPVHSTNIGYAVVMRFVEGAMTESILHPVTAEPIRSETADSYEFDIVLVPETSDVVVGTIVSVDDDGVVTVSTSGRTEFGLKIGLGRVDLDSLDTTGTVAEHLAALGHGGLVSDANPHRQDLSDIGFRLDNTMPEHLRRSHRSHLRTGNPISRAGLLQIDGSTIDTIAAGEGEEFVVDGTAFNISQDPITPALAGTAGVFEVLLDSNGVLQTKQLMTYNAGRVVTGVMPVDLDQSAAFPGTPATTLDFRIVDTVKQLSWNGGPYVTLRAPTDLSNGDAFYTLLGGAADGVLTVWVDYSALPGAGPLSDALLLVAYPDDATRMRLGHVFYLAAGAILGHGNEGVGGNVLDVRSVGSVALAHLDDDFKQLLRNVMTEMRRDGFAEGGDLSSSGFDLTVAPSIIYVNGVRIVKATQTLTITANNPGIHIYFDRDGNIQGTDTDPVSWYGIPYCSIVYLQTNGIGVSFLRDNRIVLPDVDRALKLGTDSLYSADAQQTPRLKMDQGAYGSSRGAYRGRTLLIEAPGPDGFDTVRLYANHWSYRVFGRGDQPIERTAGFDITINAKWLADDEALPPNQQSCWQADNAGRDAAVWGCDASGWYQQVKRHEDLVGSDGTWLDNLMFSISVLGGAAPRTDWSNSPFQFDSINSAITFHTTEFQNAKGEVDIRERIDLGPAGVTRSTNAIVPQNLIRAWGRFAVFNTSVSDTEVAIQGRIYCGVNVADPIYVGDGTNNLWHIPLLTRLLRVSDAKYGNIPDAAVLSLPMQVEGFDPPTSDIRQNRVRIEDDGRSTYIVVKGPVTAATGIRAQLEQSFTLNFFVVGAAADEAFPPPDALIDKNGASHVVKARTIVTGFGFDNTPLKPPLPPEPSGGFQLPDQSGGGASLTGFGQGTFDPSAGSVTLTGFGNPNAAGPVVPPPSKPPIFPAGWNGPAVGTDDNSLDPDQSGRGPLQPGGGRGPSTGRGHRGGTGG